MSMILNTALSVAARSGMLDLVQRVRGETCHILLYHSVADGPNNPYFGPAEFDRHMEMLAAEFRVMSGEEYLAHRRNGLRFRPRSVLITFDDGFENNATIVAPIMRRRGLPWMLFTTTAALEDEQRGLWFAAMRGACLYARTETTSLMGRTWRLGDTVSRLQAYLEMTQWVAANPAERAMSSTWELIESHWSDVPSTYRDAFCRMMSARQVEELASDPLVEIGAHTDTHPYLTTVSDAALEQEMDRSTQKLEEVIGRRVRTFAYPAGKYGQREIERVAALGFECAFAVTPMVGGRTEYEIPRVGIYDASLAVVRAKSLGISSLMRGIGIPTG